MSTSHTSREDWRRHVRAWKASGLSSAQYAAKSGLNANTLSWWRWRLAKEPAVAAAGARRRSRPALEWIELPPAQPSGPIDPVGSGSERIELDVAGVVVRLPGRFDAESLTRLLQLLEARR